MAHKKFGIGIIGVGMAAKPHALALQELSDRVNVVGVYCRSAEVRKEFAREYGFPAANGAGTLANHPDLDALLLLTPPDARIPLIDQFASNLKHILCEKPLERTAAAAQVIADNCRAKKVSLGVVFQHRFRQSSRKLIEFVDAGAFGRLATARIDVPYWRGQEYYDEPGRGTYARDGGGVLISQAIHTLDLMLRLTGPVAAVSALSATSRLHRMEAEDFVAAGLEFASGAVGSLTATTAAFPGGTESIALDYERAGVHLQSGVLTVNWRDGRIEQFGETSGTGGGTDPMAFPYDWHKSLIESFVDRIEAGAPPEATGDDAVRVQLLIEALLRSSREGRRTEVPSGVGQTEI